jgi:cyclopropane fatty-acyl-phospholipid synthase-like methyltransferase
MAPPPDERSTELGFEDFRRLALDESLSRYEKIGFPDDYRAGAEEAIFADIVAKLPALSEQARTIVDIGPGCSGLPRMLQERCAGRDSVLVLVDSAEMLAHLPDTPGAVKLAGAFPNCPELFQRYAGQVDAVLAYSVLHHVLVDGDVGEFVERALELLAPGGWMLLGDIPNADKRRRFLSSPAGREFHRRFTGSDEPPPAAAVERGGIDDATVLGLLARARRAGCHAYVVPQRPDLPMANRREDLLVHRP